MKEKKREKKRKLKAAFLVIYFMPIYIRRMKKKQIIFPQIHKQQPTTTITATTKTFYKQQHWSYTFTLFVSLFNVRNSWIHINEKNNKMTKKSPINIHIHIQIQHNKNEIILCIPSQESIVVLPYFFLIRYYKCPCNDNELQVEYTK